MIPCIIGHCAVGISVCYNTKKVCEDKIVIEVI